MPKFKTTRLWLTPYALACGYIEKIDHPFLSLTLFDNMGVGYSVKLHDFKKKKRIFWRHFDTLTDARKYFSRCARRLGAQRQRTDK